MDKKTKALVGNILDDFARALKDVAPPFARDKYIRHKDSALLKIQVVIPEEKQTR